MINRLDLFRYRVEFGRNRLVKVLREARQLLARPENDFAWSSWDGTEDALKEIDGLIEQIERGKLPRRVLLSVLFAPTGPIQEVSLSSGWGNEFIEVARSFDTAMAQAYFLETLVCQMHEIFGGRARWICTILSVLGLLGTLLPWHDQNVEIWFPLRLKGSEVFWSMIASTVIFAALALINWISRMRQRSKRN